MKYLLLPTTIFVSIWSVVHGFQPFTSTQLQLATNAKVVLSKSCLNLFFIDFTNKKKRVASNDKEEEEEEELLEPSSLQDEKDLSAFLTSLGQWPLYPSAAAAAAAASSSSSSLEEATQISPRSLQRTNLNNNPLANILRLEVILDLAAGLKVNETESYFSSILATADRLFQQTTTSGKPPKVKETTELDLLTTVEDILECQEEDDDSQWLLDSIPLDGFPTNTLARLSFTQSNTISSSSSSAEPPNFGKAAESFVKDATSRMEYLFNETSKGLLTPTILQDLLLRSTQVFANTTSVEQLSNEIVHVAEEIAKSRGLSAPSAAERAREATRGAANMVTVANGLLTSGYAYGSLSGVSGSEEEVVEGGGLLSPTSNDNNNSVASSKPLFADFETARRVEPLEYPWVVQKGAEMGTLAGAIYEDNFEGCHKLDHSLVANGTTANVAWMVTDSMDTMSSFYEHKHDGPLMVRTLTIRGFDASDGTVDREWVLNAICTAAAEPISTETSDIHFHSGLLGIAKDLYKELKPYIEWTSPRHKIVLNGHSIGGSLSILLLFLMVADKGAEYVQERVLRVYSHGAPPVATMTGSQLLANNKRQTPKLVSDAEHNPQCPILEAFDLPSTMIFGYIQPYDPIVRFLSEYDALYPLVDDLGPDEVTLYATGPPRSLRHVARAMFQAWDGWPQFRDHWKGTNQQYQSVGIQHILLPEPLRYLNDRFLSTNVGVPPTEAIVKISSSELLPALNATFPLDTFQISLVPQAVRSFLHHFYPAYDTTIAHYAAKVERNKVIE